MPPAKTYSLPSLRMRLVLPVVGVILAAAAWVIWQAVPPKLTVYVHDGASQPQVHSVRADDVAAALDLAKISVGAQDTVSPELTATVSPDLHIYIRRAFDVTIQADGQTHVVSTTGQTVQDVVQDLSITLSEKDRVEPGFTAAIHPGLTIRVVRVTEEQVTEAVEIPYETERQEDRSMLYGETAELQAGEPGIKQVTYHRVYENGQLVSNEPVGEEIIAEPITQVVAYGTGGVVYRGGTQYRYTRELDMKATAYSIGDGMTPGTHTRMGLPAKRGVVAVDPSVIPLGTRLYIDGYGYAIAADTGGAIKGERIDLCVDTVAEAHEFGVQWVHVYILDDY